MTCIPAEWLHHTYFVGQALVCPADELSELSELSAEWCPVQMVLHKDDPQFASYFMFYKWGKGPPATCHFTWYNP